MEQFFGELVALLSKFFEIIFHLDTHLTVLTQTFGYWTYAILFLVIFAETGLVVFPFLPGDSLLFAAGAVCALEGSAIQIEILVPLLIFAGVLGDTINYSVGKFLGPIVFTSDSSMFLNKGHLAKTQQFYERYGPSTIIIARFVPIVRTFAPFVAGIGRMSYRKFITYNVVGAVVWVGLITLAGYIFGNLPVIQRNFHVVIFAIIIISVMPMIVTWWKAKRESRRESLRESF